MSRIDHPDGSYEINGKQYVDDATYEGVWHAESAPPAPVRAVEPVLTGSLADRLAAAHVDLLALELVDREFLPASDGLFPRGVRIHIAAPMKSGKSLALLVHLVEIVSHGGRVAVLDRENGAQEYARRLKAILADRPSGARRAVAERFSYYAWPTLTLGDGAALAEALKDRDVVLIDSTRTFLTHFDLKEDGSDDFAGFAGQIVDPMFSAGVTVIQLDNAGHGDASRARGSSSKGDLADLAFSLKTAAPFDESTAGTVRLTLQAQRFGNIGKQFEMAIGGGHFGTFTRSDAAEGPSRPVELMGRITAHLATNPGATGNQIKEAVKGGAQARDKALSVLMSEGCVRRRLEGQSHRHYLLRESDEASTVPPSSTVPTPSPEDGSSNRPHRPHPLGGDGWEDGQRDGEDTSTVPNPRQAA